MEQNSLKALVAGLKTTQRAIAQALETGPTTINLIINHSEWPRKNGQELAEKFEAWLVENGASKARARAAIKQSQGLGKSTNKSAEPQEVYTVIRKQTLSIEARRTFGIMKNPFDDVQSSDEVFLDDDSRFVQEYMYQAARNAGFLAVIGESGSGKSTLMDQLMAKNQDDGNLVFIEPYVLGSAGSDKQGKMLQASHLAEAILTTIVPSVGIQASPELRFRQVHQHLKTAHRSGMRHCVCIEEAHDLTTAMLKQLKRFLELKDGMNRLLSIILIGQPELKEKLSQSNSEVREVVQRCELVELPPLKNPSAYIYHRMAKAGIKEPEKLVPAEAVEAIGLKLSGPRPKGGRGMNLQYPLAVGNLLISALNQAAELGEACVTKDIILGL